MKKRKNNRLKLAVLAASLVLGMAAGEMTSYAVVYTSEDWEEEEENAEKGPGSVAVETDSVPIQTPLINQSALKEQYHEEYKVYEESIEDVFFFYSSVKNGGITHEPVVLDIPQNLAYTVELNGVPWVYQSGETISTYGTYVFKLTGIEDASLPLSEQKEYRAVFRFRLQEKPPEPATEPAAAESVQESSESDWHSFTYDGIPIEEDEIRQFIESRMQEPQESSEDSWGGWTQSTESTQEEESTEESEEQTEEESTEESQETESSEQQETGVSPEEESRKEEDSLENTGMPARRTGNGYVSRTQVYQPAAKRYEVTFANGKVLSVNVPEGYIGPGEVEFVFPEDAEIRLYRDDEQIEEMEGNRLTEPGHYRVEVDGQPWFCSIASSIRQENHYPAPAGMHFSAASLEGESIALTSDRYVSMDRDGQYQFVLEGEGEESLDISLRKDTEPPQVEIRVKGGEAAIQYLSDDVDTIVLEKDGKVVEGFSGYSVKRPGNYQLTVTDTAGNVSTSRFSLSYRINRYGVIAGILVVLLIAGGVAFVFYTKRTVKIR